MSLAGTPNLPPRSSGWRSQDPGSQPNIPSHTTPAFSTSKGLSQEEVTLMDLLANYQRKYMLLVLKQKMKELLHNSEQAKNPVGLGG